MRPLSYSRAQNVDDAIAMVGADPASAFLAGGTTEPSTRSSGNT
jgi:xanthine dehydrogenase YagS FAD-binding subunit